MWVQPRGQSASPPARSSNASTTRSGSTQPSPTPGGIIPPHDGRGVQHLCFSIPVASLDDWVSHLDRHRIALESRVVQTHGGTSLYFRDPDGHSLEVATPGLWPNY